MPLRVYDNNAWQSPTSIRIYNDSEWKTASVGYVYDMGSWRVVFPDPVIPSISLAFGPSVTRTSVYVEFDLINADYIIVQLYAGTTQSNLLQSQTIDTNNTIVDREAITFSGLTGNTTYNIRVIAYSITENTSTFLTGSFTTSPSVTLTATAFSDLSGASVSWVTTRQSRWRVIITRTSDGLEVYRSSLDLQSGTTNSISAFFSALGNTQYTVQLDLEFTGGGLATEYTTFTTPNIIQPSINSLAGTSTCNSITASWSGSNYVSAGISLYEAIYDPGADVWNTGSLISSATYGTSITSHTFTGLASQNIYGLVLGLTSSTGQTISSTTYFGYLWIVGTADPSANAPTNFTASSDYHGKNASFTWTAATANCTTVSGYRLEYKLNTSSTWTNLSNSIASNATSFSVGSEFDSIFAPGRTYNFRLYAKTSIYGEGPPASVNLTMNNNPHNIAMSGTNSIETSSSSVLTAQLRNADYENLSISGVTISWSFTAGINPPSGSSISPTSSNTNSSGQATSTFSSGNDDGTGTVFTTTSGLGAFGTGQRVMTVNLRTGQSVTLSPSGTTKGASFTNSVHSALYSYTNTPGYPTVGSLESGDSYNNSQFDILTSRTRDARPSITISGRTATTSNTTFLANPLVSMAIRSSRAGYTTVDGPVAAVTAGVTINTTRAYQWQQFTNGTWNTNFGPAFGGTTSQTLTWSNTTFSSRQIRCRVTTTFSNGLSDESFTTNEPTIP